VDAGVRYLDGAGTEVALARPDVHHRNETLTGLGDPWGWGRFGRGFGALTLGLRAGVSLPLGRTEEDPFRLGDAGLPHQHLQFGTGTVDPLLGLEVMRSWEDVRLLAWALTLQTLYENGRGYRAGNRYAASVSALSPLGTRRFTFQAGAELLAETAERWRGLAPPEEGNRGRVDLLGLVAAMARVGESIDVGLSVRVPAVVHVVDAQLRYPAVVMLSVSAALDFGEPHTHGPGDEAEGQHDDDDEPVDWSGVDVAEAGRAGEAVDLVPVPGKVTVFDFWATWCHPCRVLDGRLAEIARRHPGAVAVRKINVIDDRSPAWQRHLRPGDHALPHVKVLDREGRLVLERTGSPQALADAIEGLISTPM
jgi:thiol-disulfide isomerase/thioredoxin